MPTDPEFLLPPGPELDKAVAEALGAEIVYGDWRIGELSLGFVSDWRTHHEDGLYDDECEDHFAPSVDLDDAFFALERFCEHDPNLDELDAFSADIEWRGHWSVSIWGGDGNKGQYKDVVSLVYLEDDAAALPHAICLAIIRMKDRCQ